MLEVRNLSAGYGDVGVLRDVSIEVKKGTLTGLLGRNGAGKTTLLASILGLTRRTAGSILLEGQDLKSKKPYTRASAGISCVQENKRIFRRLSVAENLRMGAYPCRPSRSTLTKQLKDAYELFPILSDRRDDAAGSLSGGQQQMLAIAQALMASPKILLLDEPSAGLAPALVAEVFEKIERLRDNGLTILIVEQAMEFVLLKADHVYVLDLGSIAYSGTGRSPDSRAAVEAAYFSRSDQAAANL